MSVIEIIDAITNRSSIFWTKPNCGTKEIVSDRIKEHLVSLNNLPSSFVITAIQLDDGGYEFRMLD